MATTLLFVYGTLKRGQSSHHLLTGQTFVRAARTMPVYRLVDLGSYPGLVVDRDHGLAVEGEIYSVANDWLERLDVYEGVPDLFRRDYVAIADLVQDVQAYFYVGSIPAGSATGAVWPLPVAM